MADETLGRAYNAMGNAALDFDFFDDNDGIDAATLTQKTLIDTQERMGMMLDVMPMGFLIHTEQGILFANREACRLLEVGKVDAIGQHFLASSRRRNSTRFAASSTGRFATKSPWNIRRRRSRARTATRSISS